MRALALAFVMTLAACERETTPPPAVPTNNPPEPVATFSPSSQAEASDWGGSWSTDYGTVSCQQQANQVSCSYAYENGGAQVQGRISGTVTGRRLDFAWEEGPGGAGSGHGSFLMSADGSSYEGTWGQGPSTTSGGNWNGKRL